MPIIIRSAQKVSELERLHTLFSAVFAPEIDTTPSPEKIEHLLERQDVCILLACSGEEIVGGLVAYELPLLSGEREFYLYDIAVHPDHQKQGIGTKLIQELKKQAKLKDITTIFVEAEAEDSGAVEFYRSFGEEEIAVRHFNLR